MIKRSCIYGKAAAAKRLATPTAPARALVGLAARPVGIDDVALGIVPLPVDVAGGRGGLGARHKTLGDEGVVAQQRLAPGAEPARLQRGELRRQAAQVARVRLGILQDRRQVRRREGSGRPERAYRARAGRVGRETAALSHGPAAREPTARMALALCMMTLFRWLQYVEGSLR